MRVAVVSNLNGVGLQVEAELLRDFLNAHGHKAAALQYDQPCDQSFDLLVFLEVVAPPLWTIAPRVWVVANPEWTKPDYIPFIDRAERVLAKTRDAERVLRERFDNVSYTGFLTRDKMDSLVPRERRFLHIGGNSGFRNTAAVIGAWREWRWWGGGAAPDAELTVVGNSRTVSFEPTPGVTFIRRGTDEEIIRLQNSHLFHLFPSAYEGFGHALHEAQGVGAVLLTTDAAPMNEIGAPFLVPPVGHKQNNLGTLYEVSARAIREAVPRMLGLGVGEVADLSTDARARFEQGNEAFGAAFLPLLEPPGPRMGKRSTKPKVAVYGNVGVPHSTESDWCWSFESGLGCEVLRFQENETPTDEVLRECIDKNVNLVLYIHTHSWSSPGRISVEELIHELRAAKIKTVSPHLDLYFGLNQNDQREDKVGVHPFFKTDFVMTADGSSDKRFRERGVNHVWMQPGVVARDAVLGTYQKELAGDIAFVGSERYHPEWTWRGEMIQVLRATYGDRFRVLNGFRGQRLNDLYVSAKILVGDCCFAGKPRYWSDRLPETAGRGGFILYPQIEGMCIPTATYTPKDINDLILKVDYYLEHEEERELIRRAAHEHVKAHDTYTHRARQILKTVGL